MKEKGTVPRILKDDNDGNAVNSINQGVAIWPWFHAEKTVSFPAFDLAKENSFKLMVSTAHDHGYDTYRHDSILPLSCFQV